MIEKLQWATQFSKNRSDHIIDLADKLINDPDRKIRLKIPECKLCFYSVSIGGSAMTNKDCICCGETTMYSSTDTSELCVECAKKHKLCSHCGGDIDMQVGRRKWIDD